VDASEEDDLSRYELPPVVELPDDVLFPSFPAMKRDIARLGSPPLITYIIAGGRRLTVVVERDLFKVIFFPDKKHLTSNQAALAYQWFGINRDLAKDYNTRGLDATRKALKQSKAKGMNDIVGRGILEQFEGFGDSGQVPLYDFAWLTFWPVNAAMFGEDTVAPDVCPHIREDLEMYNSKFELVANGMPRNLYPEMEKAAQHMSNHFGSMIGKGNATGDSCPILKARVEAIDPTDSRFTNNDKGRFVMSVFWAAQANTIPGTAWALAHALADPVIKAKCMLEARESNFMEGDSHFNVKVLPYISAVVKEVLRMKVANITHRKAQMTFGLKSVNGKTYRIPKGDTMTVCSYLEHMNGNTFPQPEVFDPERWLDGSKYPSNSWIPFGGGPNTCSGKFLSIMEITTLVALFFREFDADLMDPLPEEEWENVVAMVTPKEPMQCRIKYTRR